MAITGSDATITTTARDSLRQSYIDVQGVVGGTQGGPKGGVFGLSNVGAALAGVTPEMASNIATGIDNYRARIEGILNQLESVESTEAFRGEQITTSLKNFVDGVKAVSLQYLNKLVEAENEIVSSVKRAYETQDQQVSSQMSTDTGTLSSNAQETGPGMTGATSSSAGAATSSTAAGM